MLNGYIVFTFLLPVHVRSEGATALYIVHKLTHCIIRLFSVQRRLDNSAGHVGSPKSIQMLQHTSCSGFYVYSPMEVFPTFQALL